MAIRLGPKKTTTCIVISREHLKLIRGAAHHAKKIDPHMSVSSVIGNLIERNRAPLESLASAENRPPRAARPITPDLHLEFCARTDPRYQRIRKRHYVKNKGSHGQQVHFLVHYHGKIAGIISGGSAAYATPSRDAFFRITEQNRERVLNGIVDNIVFRLEVSEKNLATRVLAVWRAVVPEIWHALYDVQVYGFETFVVETDKRNGALYRADNWNLTGTTSGSAKNHNRTGLTAPFGRAAVVPKLVFCKWREGVNTPVESEYKSSWRGASRRETRRARELARMPGLWSARNFGARGKPRRS